MTHTGAADVFGLRTHACVTRGDFFLVNFQENICLFLFNVVLRSFMVDEVCHQKFEEKNGDQA